MPTGVREDDVHYVSDFGFGLVGQRETAEPSFDINGPHIQKPVSFTSEEPKS